jgi:glycosyltransferase involved in cell wall biosynthesis
MKFLVFFTDVLPLPGVPTSGTPLRTYGLVQGLRAHGHEVEMSVPRAALEGMLARYDLASFSAEVRSEIARLRESAFDFTNQATLVRAASPDVVLCGHWPAATFAERIRPLVVIDLAGPHLLERHFQGTPDHAGAVLAKLNALSRADLFIVSGAKQRLYFLSYMLRARVERPEERTITIHMPLSPRLPPRAWPAARPDYPRFVFAGVFLPWQDPSRALSRTADAIERRGRGSLTIIGGPHPHYPLRDGVYGHLVESLSRRPSVKTLPMLPYEQLIERLTAADTAVDLMRWNLERELAMTIRSTTYLWSGVPVIYNDYADLGSLINKYDAGWTVAPSDDRALDRVLESIFDDPASVARKAQQAHQLARDVFSWDRAVVPLLEALGSAREKAAEVDVDLAVPDNDSLNVLADQPVEQHFLSRIDGLSRVECFLTTHSRRRLQPVTLSLHRIGEDVGRTDSRELLAQKCIPGEAIRDNQWHALEMKPVLDSGGSRFVLSIASEARTVEESISPWTCRPRTFPMLELFHGPRSLGSAALCMRVISRPQSSE